MSLDAAESAVRLEAAAEALRKARATVECAGDPMPGVCAADVAFSTNFHPSTVLARGVSPWNYSTPQNHRAYASLVLDGFSVDELTAVGG